MWCTKPTLRIKVRLASSRRGKLGIAVQHSGASKGEDDARRGAFGSDKAHQQAPGDRS